jgi:hypothetical protein
MVELQTTDLLLLRHLLLLHLLLVGQRRISSCSCTRSEFPPTADHGIFLAQKLEVGEAAAAGGHDTSNGSDGDGGSSKWTKHPVRWNRRSSKWIKWTL